MSPGRDSGQPWPERSVTVLTGGVGGTRLVDGLAAVLPASALTAIVNTGDDCTHWGLAISPDLDTVMYTLAGLADNQRGWGLAGETFRALGMVERYGGPAWFALGDSDLATHLVRTQALAQGQALSAVTRHLCQSLGVGPRVLPMSDQPRPTFIATADRGTLPFQEWLVKERCAPAVSAVHLGSAHGSTPGQPAPGVLAAIADARLVILGPSNPYVSIDPILALDGIREALAKKPVVAVSPIVAGKAIKGPLSAMIRQLAAREPSAAAIAGHYRDHYGDLLRAFVIERGDEHETSGLDGLVTLATQTVMKSREDRQRLAREVLALGEGLL